MTNHRPDIGAEEIVRALLQDSMLQFQDMGDFLRKGICPDCGKKELYIKKSEPWRVSCNRSNNCGWAATTRELLPEVFADFSKKYAPTEAEPHRTADAVMGIDRGFDLSKIRGWYEQSSYTFPHTTNMCHTIRFYLDEARTRYWERLIDKTKKDGQKNNIGGRRKEDGSLFKGDAWLPPGMTLKKRDRVFLVEAIFHSIGLYHHDIKAAATISSNHFPTNFIKEHAGKNIAWVIALDGDKAGRDGAKKAAKKLKAMGEKYEVLLLPDNGMDWDDYHRTGKLNKEVGGKFIRDRLYYGKLFMAENVHEKAYHYYIRKNYRTFILDFANSMYSIEVKRDVLDADLNPKKKGDSDQEPTSIKLESKQGWEVFMRNHEVDPLSNILPRFLYMERDEVMGEQFYVFQINYSNGNPSDIIRMEGTNITSPDAFHKALLNKSRGGTFDGDFKQLKFLRDSWLNRKMKTVTSIPFVGYDHDTQAYVYQDAAYYKGREIQLNRDGYFQVGKHGIKTSLKGTHIVTDGEFSPNWLDNYFKAFHWQGLVLLAFWIGSLFAQQIRATHKSYPFFEFTGEPGAGKSTALEFLWKCCGRDDHEGFDVMKATVAGRRRAMNQVSNMPVVIIESDRDNGDKDAKAKQFDFDLCKPFFNGRGTGTLGVAKRGNDVEESPFRAALIISQNAEVDGGEALLQRIVHVHVDKRHHTPTSRDTARWFERQTSATVGGFLRKVLQNERRILQVYEEAFTRYEIEFGKSTKIRNERIVKNHAQIAAFGAALAVIFPAMTPERIGKLADYILQRAEIREQRLAADHPIVEQFWETVAYINNSHTDDSPEWLNHSPNEDEIAINLGQYREECQRRGQELPDLKLLKKMLPQTKRHKCISNGRNVSSVREQRKNGVGDFVPKTHRCWIFKR